MTLFYFYFFSKTVVAIYLVSQLFWKVIFSSAFSPSFPVSHQWAPHLSNFRHQATHLCYRCHLKGCLQFHPTMPEVWTAILYSLSHHSCIWWMFLSMRTVTSQHPHGPIFSCLTILYTTFFVESYELKMFQWDNLVLKKPLSLSFWRCCQMKCGHT